ncbi:MAG: lipoprotein signal peptidase [Bacteroidales bacterium]|nr:lipoprotein signal peptidase [Bacteroidales bacterium]
MRKRWIITLSIIFIVLIIDQVSKWYVKTHFILGESYRVFDWFYIHFTENAGMAFGLTLSDGEIGKIILSLLRIAAAFIIGWFIYKQIIKKEKIIYIVALSLIWAGAFGNIIDSLFYGIIYNSSEGQIAQLFPPEGGYSSFLHGKVVDMFYFPIIEGQFPQWFPIWGGEPFVFFQPVFNVADASITIGVIIILIFYKKIFHQ